MLNSAQQQELVGLADYEITNNLCTAAPKYQSWADMHVKYKNNKTLNNLCELVILNAYVLTSKKVQIKNCWFNVLKEDSFYEKHKHNTLTCVYYLKNCTDNGTIIFIDENEKILLCLDNTLQFISGDVYHTIPKHNGLDRYSMAFDLEAV